MRKLLVLSLLAFGSQAAAQPGADAPYPPAPPDPAPVQAPPPQPYPQPYAQPAPYPAPGGYVPMQPVQLTAADAELLQKGEISDGQSIGGIAANVFLGFGVGQAIQGRYSDTGWIFTIGEIASYTALFVGVAQAIDDCFGVDESCSDDNKGDGLIIGGLVGLLAFRIWSVVDAATGPQKHNQKLRELKMRLGMPMPMYTQRVMPYVNRTRDNGAAAGLVFRF